MEDEKLHTKVAVIENNLTHMMGVFDRLDTAIEKIGIVSGDIKEMLAVHQEKMSAMDEKINYNKKNQTMAQEEFKEEVKGLHARITIVNKELSANIVTTETKIIEAQSLTEKRIMAGQAEVKKFFVESHTSLAKRVKTLENWRFVMVGIFIVIGALLTYFSQGHTVNITPTNPPRTETTTTTISPK